MCVYVCVCMCVCAFAHVYTHTHTHTHTHTYFYFQDPASVSPHPMLDQLYKENWDDIKNAKWKTQDKRTNIFQVRLDRNNPPNIRDIIYLFDSEQTQAYKINAAPSLMLRINTEHQDTTNVDGERTTRFFYPSYNTALFQRAVLINSKTSLKKFCDDLEQKNIEGFALKSYENSRWVLDHPSAITFHIAYTPEIVYKNLSGGKQASNQTSMYGSTKGLGYSINLPNHIKFSKKLKDIKPNNSRHYNDNLCVIRCIAYGLLLEKTRLAPTKECLENLTARIFVMLVGGKYFYHTYPGTFEEDIIKLEVITNAAICIYEFENYEEEFSHLKCVRKSADRSTTINILKVNSHALFILDLNGLAKSYLCSLC